MIDLAASLLICLSPIAIDGDTLRCGDPQERVRLFGVQAPERGQPGAQAATEALQRLSAGGIVCDPSGASYNRIVAVCENASGQDLGAELIKAGVAKEWCSYSRNRYGTCAR